jgi:adenylate kinase
VSGNYRSGHGRVLVFLGPPGSGKGTQAELLAEKMQLAHICLGEMLREEVKLETAVGKQAKQFMQAGQLVPDALTIELARQRIEKEDCRGGFMVDGFPRSLVQAEGFEKMLGRQNLEVDRVVYFRIAEEIALQRLLGRGRADDQESIIRNRFEVYEKQTRPLIDYYRDKDKLSEIDAGRPLEEVSRQLNAILNGFH